MNLLLLNYPYLQNELKEIGHSVTSIGNYDLCNFITPILSYEEITKLINISTFDLIIYSDGLDKHPLISNFDKFTLPKICISIDSTINYFWQKSFINCFDIVFVDQISIYEKMRKFHKRVYPLLLSYDENVFSNNNVEKVYDITFVGRTNDNTRIKRSNILNKIKKAGLKLNLINGSNGSVNNQNELSKIYNQSKIVLNESLFPSINLRLFEVLGSGSLLFNEESDDYIKEYFQDKEHLVYYNQENLIERLKDYLENKSERETIAKKGNKSAKKYHKDSNRAKFIVEIIEENFEGINISAKNKKIKLSLALSALYLNLKWNNIQNDDSAKKLFDQNTEIIYNIINNTDNLLSEFNSTEISDYLKLCYSINKKDKIVEIFNSIDFSKLHNKEDSNLIQFILFYSIENKLSNIISDILNNFILRNVIENREKIIQNCSIDEKYYYYYYAKYLENIKNIDRINFGFTQTNISAIFFTIFDFYHYCMRENIEFEESTLQMIKILIPAKAYDNIYVLYDILRKKYPMNDEYVNESQKYKHLSYL